MIARVQKDGNYIEVYDAKGKKLKRSYNNGELLDNSDSIVLVKDGNYIEIFDENLKQIKRLFCKFDRFIGASGETFSVQDGNYAETYDKKGKKLSRTFSK